MSSLNGDAEIITICEVLLDKHPLGKPLHPSTLLDSSPDIVNPIIFDGLNADVIHYPLYKPQVLMVPLVWVLLPGIVCAALLNQPLLHCALLWLLLDIQYVQKLFILTGYLPSWLAILLLLIRNPVSILLVLVRFHTNTSRIISIPNL